MVLYYMKYFIKIAVFSLLLTALFGQSYLQQTQMSKFYKFYYHDEDKKETSLDSDTEFYKYLIWLKNNPYGQTSQQYQGQTVNNNAYVQGANGIQYKVNSQSNNNNDCGSCGTDNGNIKISIEIPNNCNPCQSVPVQNYPMQRSYYAPTPKLTLPELSPEVLPYEEPLQVTESPYSDWKIAISFEVAVTEPWGATGQNNGLGYSIQTKAMIRPYYWNKKKSLKPWRYGIYIDRSHFTGATKVTTNWQPPEGTYADRYGIAAFVRYDITELYLKEPIIGVYINPEIRLGTINYNNPHPEEYAVEDIPVPTGNYNTVGLGYEFGAYYCINDALAMELKVYQTYDYNEIFSVLGQLNVMQQAHMENGVRFALLYRF